MKTTDASTRFPRLARLMPWALGAVAMLALTVNLGNHFLWQDEAQTALLAMTIPDRGVPHGTDGSDYFSQEAGAEYGNDYVWKWHTWLSFYLVAASFELLGTSTLAARLPFALLGVATILLAYRFCLRWTSTRAAYFASALLLTCVPFLLLARQARYYSAATFFGLLALHAFLKFERRERGSALLFVAASTALFHSHFVYYFALAAAVCAYVVVRGERERRAAAFSILAGSAAICLPWMVWLGAPYDDVYRDQIGVMSGLRKFWQFGRQFDEILPLTALALLVFLSILGRFISSQRDLVDSRGDLGGAPATLLAVFSAAGLVVLSLTSPAAFFRYLAPLIPPLLALAGIAIASLPASVARLAPLVVVVAMLGQPLAKFTYELTHDFDGPIEGIVEFLRVNAAPTDVVAITYGDLPLKFYLDQRIVGGLTGEDLSPALHARWVILRHHTIARGDSAVRDFLLRKLPLETYRKHVLPCVDTPFENRESPFEHRFRTSRGGPRVEILERPDRRAASDSMAAANGANSDRPQR